MNYVNICLITMQRNETDITNMLQKYVYSVTALIYFIVQLIPKEKVLPVL